MSKVSRRTGKRMTSKIRKIVLSAYDFYKLITDKMTRLFFGNSKKKKRTTKRGGRGEKGGGGRNDGSRDDGRVRTGKGGRRVGFFKKN